MRPSPDTARSRRPWPERSVTSWELPGLEAQPGHAAALQGVLGRNIAPRTQHGALISRRSGAARRMACCWPNPRLVTAVRRVLEREKAVSSAWIASFCGVPGRWTSQPRRYQRCPRELDISTGSVPPVSKAVGCLEWLGTIGVRRDWTSQMTRCHHRCPGWLGVSNGSVPPCLIMCRRSGSSPATSRRSSRGWLEPPSWPAIWFPRSPPQWRPPQRRPRRRGLGASSSPACSSVAADTRA